MPLYQNVSGSIKEIKTLTQNVNGTLKSLSSLKQNVGGTLKEIFALASTPTSLTWSTTGADSQIVNVSSDGMELQAKGEQIYSNLISLKAGTKFTVTISILSYVTQGAHVGRVNIVDNNYALISLSFTREGAPVNNGEVVNDYFNSFGSSTVHSSTATITLKQDCQFRFNLQGLFNGSSGTGVAYVKFTFKFLN